MNPTFEQKFSPNHSPSTTRSTHTDPKAQEELLSNQWDLTKEKDPSWHIKKQNWDKLENKMLLPHLPFSLMGRGKNNPQRSKQKNAKIDKKIPDKISYYNPSSHDFNKLLPQKNSSGSPKKAQCLYELKVGKYTLYILEVQKKSQRWRVIKEMWFQLGKIKK